jgi:hypothetical protein
MKSSVANHVAQVSALSTLYRKLEERREDASFAIEEWVYIAAVDVWSDGIKKWARKLSEMVEALPSETSEDTSKHLLEVKRLFEDALLLYDIIADEKSLETKEWEAYDLMAEESEQRLKSKCKEVALLIARSRERPRRRLKILR